MAETQIRDPYATHLPILRALGQALPIVHVLELGAGLYSTACFLDRQYYPALKLLVSDEPDHVWRDRLRRAIGFDDHRWMLVSMPTGMILRDLDCYELIFVDCGAHEHQRAPVIAEVARQRPAAVVVIHDFERLAYQLAAEFDHIHVIALEKPWTAVCWNGDRPDVEDLSWQRA